ncbi:hypothetical protein BON30_41565 [Cystobacter ferrugineus]|uniref:Uncharacterized protein n=1 Tax=Cystobacter ferrugineus TaxID=83449 RepID=A0A1L9AXE6_9BACT|nr:hypothetical protein BON30_41565 [Cystobacter ferrugineus]
MTPGAARPARCPAWCDPGRPARGGARGVCGRRGRDRGGDQDGDRRGAWAWLQARILQPA